MDSIYRRIDDDFIDPLEFRPDSLLGVAGLMGAYRAGNVGIANALGTGVADDKAVYHYVPEMIRFYLGEEPILDNLPTWLLADPEQREYVLDRLHELVVKPTGESGGKGVFIGPLATEEQIEAQKLVLAEAPERWIAQQTVALSTVPTAMPDGSLAPRHVDLRPFAVFGEEIKIVPGGAHTRRAPRRVDDREQLAGRRVEGHLGARGRPARGATARPRGRVRAAAAARPPPGGLARPAAATAAAARAAADARPDRPRPLLARPPPRARGAHRAHARRPLPRATSRAARTIPARSRCRGTRSLIMGAEPPADGPARRGDVVRLLTTAAENPVSIVSSTTAAREGARTLRDTISAEMWESVNTFDLQLARRDLDAGLQTGPYSIYSLSRNAARCSGASPPARCRRTTRAHSWSRAAASRPPTWCCACCAWRSRRRPRGDGPEAPRRDGNALALLRAVGGFQAFMRAAAAPPNAEPVSRFMLYEREFPDSVASSIDRSRRRSSA